MLASSRSNILSAQDSGPCRFLSGSRWCSPLDRQVGGVSPSSKRSNSAHSACSQYPVSDCPSQAAESGLDSSQRETRLQQRPTRQVTSPELSARSVAFPRRVSWFPLSLDTTDTCTVQECRHPDSAAQVLPRPPETVLKHCPHRESHSNNQFRSWYESPELTTTRVDSFQAGSRLRQRATPASEKGPGGRSFPLPQSASSFLGCPTRQPVTASTRSVVPGLSPRDGRPATMIDVNQCKGSATRPSAPATE